MKHSDGLAEKAKLRSSKLVAQIIAKKLTSTKLGNTKSLESRRVQRQAAEADMGKLQK